MARKAKPPAASTVDEPARAYGALKTTTLHSDTSRPFAKPRSGRIAVKVINHLGDEVIKVFRVV